MDKSRQDKTDILKILLVEDVPSDAELIYNEIKRNKISFTKLLVDIKEDYLQGLKVFEPDLIISDYSLPTFDGMKALSLRNELMPLTPFILVTGSINEEVAVDCMKAGADDYILKENLSRLGPAILNSIKKITLLKEKKAFQEELLKSEMRLQKAQSIAHIGNWELDLSSKTVWCSDEAIRIYGYDNASHEFPLEKVQNTPLAEFRPLLDEAFDRLLKYNEPYEAEFNIKRADDGELRTIYSKAELVHASDSEQVKVVGVIQDITDRKQAKEALNESEKKYRRIFDNVQDLYYEATLDGTIIEISPSIRIISRGQYDRESLIGRSMYEFYSDAAERQSLLTSLKELGSVSDFEILLKNRDGSLIPCSVSSKIILDNNGKPEKIIGSMRDITRRKKAEETVEVERRMLRTLIDNLPDTIYVQDIECRKVIANKADVENIGAATEAEVLGKTDLELFPGDIGVRGYAEDKEVILTGKPVIDLEEEFISASGIKRWLQTTKIPLHDKEGNIMGLVGIGHNITERRLAEEELKQSYTFTESLLKTIPFGMDIVDDQGNILFLSENFRLYFGDDAAGKKCWELYRDDKTRCTDCPLANGIIIGETEVYESYGILGGRIFEISHTGMMYKGKKAMLEIFQDITDRKTNEKELIHAKEKAEESDRLKTAFLHNISHEIRTPMNAIVGFSTLLAEPDIDVQSRNSYTEVIMQSSNHLLSIITDIFDISNIEANLVTAIKSEININSALKKLYNQLVINADEKRLEFTYQTDLADSDALILTDSTKLTQVISNILSNAFKFTNSGYIKFGYEVKHNLLEFFVADSGIGIPEEYQERIFDRFYQVENKKSRLYEGTGLGLAISKAYVELLGGKIWVSSGTETTGTGTSFFFTVPLERPVIETKAETAKEVLEGFSFPAEKKILVAEDIDSNFKLITYFLAKTNARIIRAVNGKDALDKALSEKDLDLILMDIKMPVMDGYTAVKLIRETNQAIPIIAQTAYAEDKDKAFESGCSGFISKPFDKKSLIKIIREFI